jgi:acyl-CoA reductase-like NAD-dependent aldehyde dehydrogenase
MPKFPFQYSREQRHLIVVEAKDYDEAYEKAMEVAENLRLTAPDDESDDPGEITDAESVDEEVFDNDDLKDDVL